MCENTSQNARHRQTLTSLTSTGSSLSFHQEEWFQRLPMLAEEFLERHHRPLVTVSYAQSVDGSIASRNRQQLMLSSAESMILTHRIRAASDAVVIGINTLLADDPQLTVRLVEGQNPQPIILDSNLRFPPTARILEENDHKCWLASTAGSGPGRVDEVIQQGAEVIYCRPDRRGRVDLLNLLSLLGERGIKSLMVEGGSQVISSFIEARLVDKLIITITPCLVGGLPVLDQPLAENGRLLPLNHLSYQSSGPDLILWAQPLWPEA